MVYIWAGGMWRARAAAGAAGCYFFRNRRVIKPKQKNSAGIQIGTHLESFQYVFAIRCARLSGSGADLCRPGHHESP
jgi:hypothetical protein